MNATTVTVRDATKKETKLLVRRGWHPVVREKIVDYIWNGRRKIPIVEHEEITAWTHPSLAFQWPTADALQLEGERSKSNRRVLALFRLGPNAPRRQRKEHDRTARTAD